MIPDPRLVVAVQRAQAAGVAPVRLPDGRVGWMGPKLAVYEYFSACEAVKADPIRPPASHRPKRSVRRRTRKG